MVMITFNISFVHDLLTTIRTHDICFQDILVTKELKNFKNINWTYILGTTYTYVCICVVAANI